MTREMKDSGIEWIGEIPEDWEVMTLGNVADISTGNTPRDPDNIKYSKTEGVEWLKTNNLLGVDGVSNSSLKIKEQYISEARLTNPNSVLVTCIGDIGKLGYTSKPKAFNQQINAITFTKNIVYWKYGMYALYSQREQQESLANVNVLKILNRENQKKVVITIPKDINEQIKISNALDKKCLYIRKLINKTQQSIEELKKYKQSLITEAVTKGLNPHVEMKDSGIEWIGKIPRHWEVFSPFRVLKVIRGNTSFKKDDMKPSGDYVAVQYGQIYQLKEVSEEYDKYIDAEFYKEDQEVLYGDTILVSTSETIEDLGHSCYYNRRDTGLLGGEQLLLRPKSSNIHHKFLFYASTYFQNDLKKFATGIKVYRFNIGDLKKIRMVIPPIKEQKEILRKLDKEINTINKLIEDKQKVIEELESYKKSLIYEYVTGKQSV